MTRPLLVRTRHPARRRDGVPVEARRACPTARPQRKGLHRPLRRVRPAGQGHASTARAPTRRIPAHPSASCIPVVWASFGFESGKGSQATAPRAAGWPGTRLHGASAYETHPCPSFRASVSVVGTKYGSPDFLVGFGTVGPSRPQRCPRRSARRGPGLDANLPDSPQALLVVRVDPRHRVCHLPSAICRLPTADCRLPTADCRLPEVSGIASDRAGDLLQAFSHPAIRGGA